MFAFYDTIATCTAARLSPAVLATGCCESVAWWSHRRRRRGFRREDRQAGPSRILLTWSSITIMSIVKARRHRPRAPASGLTLRRRNSCSPQLQSHLYLELCRVDSCSPVARVRWSGGQVVHLTRWSTMVHLTTWVPGWSDHPGGHFSPRWPFFAANVQVRTFLNQVVGWSGGQVVRWSGGRQVVRSTT